MTNNKFTVGGLANEQYMKSINLPFYLTKNITF